jgi:uncharacterized protein (TIGR03437 family)
MSYRRTIPFLFGLLIWSVFQLSSASLSHKQAQQQITPSPSGPFHVEGNRILDSKGTPFLMKGTQLTEFHAETVAEDNRSGMTFGAHSPTSLSAIRLRFNMNTVRLPVNVLESSRPDYFTELAKVVRRATDIDLLVVIAAHEPGAGLPSQESIEFWSRCAALFKDSPNVMFDVFPDPVAPGELHSTSGWNVWKASMEKVVHAARSAGATQPVILTSWNDDRLFEGAGNPVDDPNVIYQASPRYASNGRDADRDLHYGFLTSRAPVLASGWDLNIDSAGECAAIPSDPTTASAMVEANLNYFDAHNMSWIVSEYKPGKLIKDWSLQDATSLENGWTCGQSGYPQPGIGRMIEAHLRATEERGMFVVSAGGGPDLPRGGFAMAYGPAGAEHDSVAPNTRHLPKVLGGISVQITDSKGITRPAGILWAHAGWGQVNYVVPLESAVGPATMRVVRADGSMTVSNITIADAAPGFWTGVSCRGPALGEATQTFADGRISKSPISACNGVACASLPIPMSSSAKTTIRLRASGIRNAGGASNIDVAIGGVHVPVVSYGPTEEEGVDQVTLEIPSSLSNLGEADLICHVRGRVSNAVQVAVGGRASAGARL